MQFEGPFFGVVLTHSGPLIIILGHLRLAFGACYRPLLGAGAPLSVGMFHWASFTNGPPLVRAPSSFVSRRGCAGGVLVTTLAGGGHHCFGSCIERYIGSVPVAGDVLEADFLSLSSRSLSLFFMLFYILLALYLFISRCWERICANQNELPSRAVLAEPAGM